MSYTIPEYVDTKEQAVLALASTIKGEAVTGGDGSVNRALDILADVLAEQDVSVPQTDAGAILALAQYASGMVKPEGTIAITENGEGIDVSQYATADVSVSGGGGGDFTTAEVSITFNIETDSPVVLPAVQDFPPQVPVPSRALVEECSETKTITVILYKGVCEGRYNGSGTVSTSGNVEWDEYGGAFEITGDCTITVS